MMNDRLKYRALISFDICIDEDDGKTVHQYEKTALLDVDLITANGTVAINCTHYYDKFTDQLKQQSFTNEEINYILDNVLDDLRFNFIWIPYGCATVKKIEQCIGLKDKNGKLIYDGDIIKNNHGYIYSVKCNRKECRFVLSNKVCGGMSIYESWFKEFEIEVIGNIHENKEILDVVL